MLTSVASTLRIIDANANRAREGLRVMEDYARFVLDDEQLCAGLKSVRHTLAVALKPVLPDAILHRDTPADVGTKIQGAGEVVREDLAAVVVAAGKRTGEALRCLEEFLKIDDSPAAAAIESCRYQLYELEKRVVLTLRPAHAKLASAKLYVLITASACARGDWLAATRSALLGRADILQLREKDLEGGELLVRACEFVRLCRDAGAISIINDRVDIAQLAGADGVHLGQGDLPAAEARKLLGHRALIGVSTHQPSQARQAVLDGADYIGAGPVYPSATKPRDISPGLPYLRELSGMSPPFPLPVFAIAGITEARIPEVLSTGMTRIAVTAAATGSADVQAACGRLRHALG